MPFYRTKAIVYRPYSGLTPLGITRVVIESETEAENGHQARELAIEQAREMVKDLDHVEAINAEIRE